jgi:sulfur carrier protein ThiS
LGFVRPGFESRQSHINGAIMKIFIEKTGTIKEIDFSGTGSDLCILLNIPLESVIIVCNNDIVTEDVELDNNDSIELLSVISGG